MDEGRPTVGKGREAPRALVCDDTFSQNTFLSVLAASCLPLVCAESELTVPLRVAWVAALVQQLAREGLALVAVRSLILVTLVH